MAKALGLLQMANALLRGESLQIVAKAENEVESVPPDERVQGASPDDTAMSDARQEAQAGQQAQGQPGDLGASEPDGDEGQGGSGDNDGDEEVSKAELLDSLCFLAKAKGITHDEIAKAFSGLEGDPSKTFHPVGKGEELLEEIVLQQKGQNKILDLIAEALNEMAKQTVSLRGEVAKANQEIAKANEEIAKAQCETAEARKSASEALEKLNLLPRTAPARAPKAETGEFAKALPPNIGQPNIKSDEVVKLIFEGKLTPEEGVLAGRRLNYGHA
jgi:hypothetical protein